MIKVRRSRVPVFVGFALVLYLVWTQGIPTYDAYAHFNGVRFHRSTFDWSAVVHKHRINSVATLPAGNPLPLPRIQHDFTAGSLAISSEELAKRRDAVRQVFLKGWNNYKERAWMHDELLPVSGGSKDPFGGWAATLVDSLDTLWIMDLHADFRRAVKAVATIDWAKPNTRSCNLFETTIRHLGGLLSAYDLSGEPALLAKAAELGDMLYMAFDTPNRMPPFWLFFDSALKGTQTAGQNEPSAAICSLSMEFTRLSQFTRNPKYFDATDRIKDFLRKTQNETRLPGMWPMLIDFQRETVQTETFTLGGRSDSLYEYLPKMYALLGGLDPVYKDLTLRSLDTVKENLLFRPMTPDKADILFSGRVSLRHGNRSDLVPEGEHLTCFAGGMFELAGKLFERVDYVDLGEKLARGCAWAYASFPLKIMPEGFDLIDCKTHPPDFKACEWDEERWTREGSSMLPEGFKAMRDARYILRPEAIESIFYSYRITGKEEYLDTAWNMFQAIQKATDAEFGNAAVPNVNKVGEKQALDSMESFWFAETLKYFYLIFSSPDLISLDDFVLNTEAHPFRRPKPDVQI